MKEDPTRYGVAALVLVCLIVPLLHFATPKIAQKNLDLSAFQNINLESKAYVVYDINNEKVIYGKDSEEPKPLASITKVMTALVASDELYPDTIIKANTSSTSSNPKEESWYFKDLLSYTLVLSSNNGAEAIADKVSEETGRSFTDLMNQRAKDLGLTNTNFNNPTGLDLNKSLAGATSSPIDVAKLLAYVVKKQPSIIEDTTKKYEYKSTVDGSSHYVQNTNLAVNRIPGLIASKTGLTNLAGGNLAVVFDVGLNKPVAVVVLGSSENGRFKDTEKLVNATIEYYSNNGL